MTDNRTELLRVRLTKAEHDALAEKAAAAGYDHSTFVRVSCGLQAAPSRQDPRPAGAAAWEQVSRIINNLQQVARVALEVDRPPLLEAATWFDEHLARAMREGAELSGINLRSLKGHGRQLNTLAAEANAKRTATSDTAQAAHDIAAEAADIIKPALIALGWIQPEQNEG